jgi:hypothetical protein
VKQFDIDALKRDLDQLWAEAAAREAAGASIRLAQELWPAAEKEQAQRTISEPFYDQLYELGHVQAGKISSELVWQILDVRGAQRTQDCNARMGKAMRDLGWRRANEANTVRIGGRLMVGYVKGEPPWPTVTMVEGEVIIEKEETEKEEGVRLKGEEHTARVTLLGATEAALRVLYDAREVWLPKSQVQLGATGEDGLTEITMPRWLARKKSIPF